eukprot:TRINITY_DN47495_c0_g1_i1.p1 TRINITY_DN47495_c0_g1~~TRINITY_DN47495_c0_g1_i1.p1  ORF type:complete len:512 (+),score=111.17 TRINITY_DN47495_c0_g1_i1:80-1615(+)
MHRGGRSHVPVVFVGVLALWMLCITLWLVNSLGSERTTRGPVVASLDDSTKEALKAIKSALREQRRDMHDLQQALADVRDQIAQIPASDADCGKTVAEAKSLRKKLEDCNRATRFPPTARPTRPTYDDDDSRADDLRPPPPTPAPPRPPRRRGSSKQRGIDDTGRRDELEQDAEGTIAVVVFTYRRANDLQRCLKRVLDVLDGDSQFRVFVSQDGTQHPQVTEVAEDFSRRGVVHLVHERNDSGATFRERQLHFESYYAIAHHYGWAMKEIFSVPVYKRLIVLEEDLEIATDFFQYMSAMSPLLDEDESLFCVSAWNDNGKSELVSSRETVYRTDFFPGLGWMMRRELWDELGPIWPAGFWDDWLRQPKHRRSRSCIRPEIPRSYMRCGPNGVSGGQFCRQYLSRIQLDDKPVDWSNAVDLESLKKDTYDAWLKETLASAATIHSAEDIMEPGGEYKIYYTTNREFSEHATRFGLMPDFKDNVPRTAYRGTVTFRWQGSRVHLVSRSPLYK